MNLKAFFTMPLAFIMMLVSLAFPPKAEGIAVIYVHHIIGLVGSREYKIDLARKNLWEYSSSGGSYWSRETKAPFEGFRFAGRLTDEKIAAFRTAAEEYGFDTWEGKYEYDGSDPIVADGTTWFVDIIFADGTRKNPTGYCAWPDHWAEMGQAFEALTGLRIL